MGNLGSVMRTLGDGLDNFMNTKMLGFTEVSFCGRDGRLVFLVGSDPSKRGLQQFWFRVQNIGSNFARCCQKA